MLGLVLGAAPAVRPQAFPPGTQLWLSHFAGGDNATSLGVSPDGRTVFVTGFSSDWHTLALRATTGKVLWHSEYDPPWIGSNAPYSLAVSPDGSRVFVTGYATLFTGGRAATTIAYDSATGAQQWLAQYESPNSVGSSGVAVAVAPDGTRVFVTGTSSPSFTDTDVLTLGFDAATGIQLWAALYDGPTHKADIATDLAAAPDGAQVYVSGYSPGGGIEDAIAIAYHAFSGAERWVARYDGARSNDLGESVAVSPDGSRVYLAGRTTSAPTGVDYLTVAYDATTGGQAWVVLHDGPGTDDDFAEAVLPSPDGRLVFVTGESGPDAVTIAYDSVTGLQNWLAAYSMDASDVGHYLAIDSRGTKLYVGGNAGLYPNIDYLVLSYDAGTGNQRWAATYNGPGSDYDALASIGLSPNGKLVYVTGTSAAPNLQQDFATVALVA